MTCCNQLDVPLACGVNCPSAHLMRGDLETVTDDSPDEYATCVGNIRQRVREPSEKVSSRPRRSPLRGPLAHRVVGAQLAGIIQPTTNQPTELTPDCQLVCVLAYTTLSVAACGRKNRSAGVLHAADGGHGH